MSFQEKSYIDSTIETVLSDIKHQQLKSMSGDTGGTSAGNSFGIHFTTSNYILFQGITYDGTDPKNYVIDIDDSLEFSSVTFPQSRILFTKGSGEIAGYTPGSNTVTVRHIGSNQTKTITINGYGVITNVQ